jgi:hypothetical protein
MEWAFGTSGTDDKARYLATLFIEDIADHIRTHLDPHFDLIRYAEHLASYAPRFDELHSALQAPLTPIDSLSLSSVLLDRLTTIEFRGATPPRCAVSGSLTPFNSLSLSTPADITVIVPEGSFDAYSDALGIGSYFNCFPKLLTVSSNGYGTASADKPRYYAGETAVLTVTPAGHCHFVSWEGDGSENIIPLDDTHFTYVMDSSFRTFTAVFAEDTHTAIDTAPDPSAINTFGNKNASDTPSNASSARKFLRNGTLLILLPDGTLLNASGSVL